MEHMHVFKFLCSMLVSIVLGDEYFTSYPGSLGILRRGPKPKVSLVGILSGDTNPSENIHGT